MANNIIAACPESTETKNVLHDIVNRVCVRGSGNLKDGELDELHALIESS